MSEGSETGLVPRANELGLSDALALVAEGRAATRTWVGSRTSTMWPFLLRSTKRKIPWDARRRMDSRAGAAVKPEPEASHAMEKWMRRWHCKWLWRNR